MGWYILAGTALLVLLLLLAKLKVEFRADSRKADGRLELKLSYLVIRLDLLRMMEKGKKEEKKEEKPAGEKPGLFEKARESAELLRLFLTPVQKAFGVFRKKAVFERLYFAVRFSLEDPAATALAYGGLCAVVFGSLSFLDSGFKVRDRAVAVTPAFLNKNEFSCYFDGILYMRIAHIIFAGVIFLLAYAKSRKKRDFQGKSDDLVHQTSTT